MKNTKLLLFGLLTSLFVSFCSAGNFDLFDNFSDNIIVYNQSLTSNLKFQIYEGKTYCYTLTNDNLNSWDNAYLNYLGSLNYGSCSTNTTYVYSNSSYCFKAECNVSQFQLASTDNYSRFNVNVYQFDDSLSNSDCGSVEDELSIKSGYLNTCLNTLNEKQGLLTTCQSDLSSCQNGCDTLVNQCLLDKSNIQSSYSGCLETNSSLQNYNDSLSDQLNQCLMSGSGSAGSGDFTIYEYQLSWFDGFTNLHLPITNSLNLPYGYRGYLNDGVLSIKNLENNDLKLNIGDNDFKENVVSNYGVIYLFLMSSGLFLIMLYAIRRYFIGLKSIK